MSAMERQQPLMIRSVRVSRKSRRGGRVHKFVTNKYVEALPKKRIRAYVRARSRFLHVRFSDSVMTCSCDGRGTPATGQQSTPMCPRVIFSTCACAISGVFTHVS